MEKEDIMQVLSTTGKVILLPILLLLKTIMIVFGLMLKLSMCITVISTGGFAGVVQGILSFFSTLTIILMLYNYIWDKGLEWTPFIVGLVMMSLGVVLIEIAESVFGVIYSIGDFAIEKGIEMPIWL